jgi:hypothetical protein
MRPVTRFDLEPACTRCSVDLLPELLRKSGLPQSLNA